MMDPDDDAVRSREDTVIPENCSTLNFHVRPKEAIISRQGGFTGDSDSCCHPGRLQRPNRMVTEG
jgi:hypothetical protein